MKVTNSVPDGSEDEEFSGMLQAGFITIRHDLSASDQTGDVVSYTMSQGMTLTEALGLMTFGLFAIWDDVRAGNWLEGDENDID